MTEAKKAIRRRGAVRDFSEAMERKLRKHDGLRGRRGWECMSIHDLTNRLNGECAELIREQACLAHARRIHGEGAPATRTQGDLVQDECLDVANFAMMIHDNIARGNTR